MTDNKETIEMLKMLKEQALKSHNDTAILEVKIDSFNFVLDEAIKALKQQPCEDCISRQAVKQVIIDSIADLEYESENREMQDIIDKLPSVTPKEKTGKWIYRQGIFGSVYCSECDLELKTNNTKYCPNCGTRMVSE